MFERTSACFLQNAYIANQARINSTLTETAEEKFIKLGKSYPELYNVCRNTCWLHTLDLLLKPLEFENTLLERNKN
jgi:hypothetical protein